MNDSNLHEANRRKWDAAAEAWKQRADARGIWKRCHEEPSLVLSPTELRFLQDVAGKTVCVLGSGDNEVVFALAGLGANVTSMDISQRQLDIAAERADLLGLDIHFHRSDVSDLSGVGSGQFDYVYTGGHVSIWLSDLRAAYAEAVRILKVGGLYVVNEYHPFRRLWKDGSQHFELATPYFEKGPFEYQSDQGFSQFEFHWSVADHVQAILAAGCELLTMEEAGDQNDDWNSTELTGLPETMLLVGKKT